jgi:hypothetical protein
MDIDTRIGKIRKIPQIVVINLIKKGIICWCNEVMILLSFQDNQLIEFVHIHLGISSYVLIG